MVRARRSPAGPVAGPLAALAALALACAGCGPGGPTLHSAGGVVRFADGAPVVGAVVEFLPAAGGPAARGRTDEGGRFILATGGAPGAVAGPHRVGVSQAVLMDGMPGHVRHMAQKQVVPPYFASPATSDLRATVAPDAANDFTFEIVP